MKRIIVFIILFTSLLVLFGCKNNTFDSFNEKYENFNTKLMNRKQAVGNIKVHVDLSDEWNYISSENEINFKMNTSPLYLETEEYENGQSKELIVINEIDGKIYSNTLTEGNKAIREFVGFSDGYNLNQLDSIQLLNFNSDKYKITKSFNSYEIKQSFEGYLTPEERMFVTELSYELGFSENVFNYLDLVTKVKFKSRQLNITYSVIGSVTENSHTYRLVAAVEYEISIKRFNINEFKMYGKLDDYEYQMPKSIYDVADTHQVGERINKLGRKYYRFNLEAGSYVFRDYSKNSLFSNIKMYDDRFNELEIEGLLPENLNKAVNSVFKVDKPGMYYFEIPGFNDFILEKIDYETYFATKDIKMGANLNFTLNNQCKYLVLNFNIKEEGLVTLRCTKGTRYSAIYINNDEVSYIGGEKDTLKVLRGKEGQGTFIIYNDINNSYQEYLFAVGSIQITDGSNQNYEDYTVIKKQPSIKTFFKGFGYEPEKLRLKVEKRGYYHITQNLLYNSKKFFDVKVENYKTNEFIKPMNFDGSIYFYLEPGEYVIHLTYDELPDDEFMAVNVGYSVVECADQNQEITLFKLDPVEDAGKTASICSYDKSEYDQIKYWFTIEEKSKLHISDALKLYDSDGNIVEDLVLEPGRYYFMVSMYYPRSIFDNCYITAYIIKENE